MHRYHPIRPGSLVPLVGVLMLVGGCAGVGVRIDGTSGPLAWRVTDLAVVTREIQGHSVDGQAFTLVIRNISDRTLTLEKMDQTVYRPRTSPGFSTYAGRWQLQPGAEWTMDRFSALVCKSYGGCTESRATQVSYQIIFTGTNDQNRPVEARLDITLPPAAVGRSPVVR